MWIIFITTSNEINNLMKISVKIIVLLVLPFLLTVKQASARMDAPAPVTVTSPDGKIKLVIDSKGGTLFYHVNFKSAQVIEPSMLGLIIDGKTIGTDAVMGKVTKTAVNETYPYRGVHSTASNHYNGAKIEIKDSYSGFTLEARVFNNGVAFRYLINGSGPSVVERDLTAFTIPAGSYVWSQSNIKAYEGKYSKQKVEDFKKDDLIGPPATVELPNNAGYVAITEGGLTDFAGMSLIADSNNVFKANLTGNTHKTGTVSTPWRIIEIGADLNTLVNCDIIADVSPAFDPKLFPKGYDTDWIKPGRSVWSWLAKNRSITLENMKRFTDYAAALGFEYNLVDEGWANWKDGNRDNWDMMKELVDYSAPKGVKIWVWKAYPDRKGIPGIKDSVSRIAFFGKCKQIGVAGLKIDFFDSESQEVIDFYQAALRDAARYHLMIDFHGANKPTGETRTWPNEMSREAIRGMENRPPWAQTNTIVPFTRYLAGHADYTPMHFGDRIGEISWAQHIATMVVFTSPLLCLGADPQNMLDNPFKAMLQSIPSTWDETIVLPQSKIGDLVLYARRKGNSWFIAAMNGVNQQKNVDIKLSFLQGGKYMLSAVGDDPQQQANGLPQNAVVSRKSVLTISMNANGGYVGKLIKR